MKTMDEKIGYLIAKAEEQRNDIEALSLKLDRFEGVVAQKLKTIETLIAVGKFIGLAIVAVLTFKFGDVSRLWDHFFS